MLESKGISERPQLKVGFVQKLLVFHMLMNDSIYERSQPLSPEPEDLCGGAFQEGLSKL